MMAANACEDAAIVRVVCNGQIRSPFTTQGDLMRPSFKSLCFSAALWMVSQAANAEGITVLTALYGQSCGAAHANVTAQVKLRCDRQASCQYRVEVGTLGDPAPNCPKNFVVLFGCPGQTPVRLVQLPGEASGRTAVLSCVVPQGPAQPQ